MEKIDVAIIGGGVIGLAVASGIAAEDKDIYILEKNKAFGQETSSRNSEVIHSGIYYPHDSLKTKTCVEGNRLLYERCQENGVACKKTGKLIVARDESEIEAMEDLFAAGSRKGLEGIRMLTCEEVGKYEPSVKSQGGIYLPMTGIIDSHALMEYFLFKAREKNADIIYDAKVTGIQKKSHGYEIIITNENGESDKIEASIVINCAGLCSDIVSALAGMDNEEYRLSYCKGDYFRVAEKKSSLVKMLVYPVCRVDDSTLGIHATPDLAGGVRLGPDAEYLSSRDIDYSVDENKKREFLESVKTFLPFIEADDLSPDTSGVRPKLQGQGEAFRDFVIKHEKDSGFEGFINLIGIESPGLTASPAIADMVAKMVKECW